MGALPEAEPQNEIDEWLRRGGLVVAASERAARALISAYHRARQREGLGAWVSPKIQDWHSFVRTQWEARARDGRLLLNRSQEQSIWAGIAAADVHISTVLEGPRYRLAALAMEAHDLLCSHAPRYLRAATRAGWQYDAAAFSRWLAAFDEICLSSQMMSPSRLAVELLQILDQPSAAAGAIGEATKRPPILLAGFDRILPVQRAVFNAWGSCHEASPAHPAAQVQFYSAPHEQAELEACALWCGRELAVDPGKRILVITQDAATRRGEIERAFLRYSHVGNSLPFEFSLGIPLSSVTFTRAALLLLRWLSAPLTENELDWLLSTGLAAEAGVGSLLQAHMRHVRRKGLQQPEWTLKQFLQSFSQRTQDRPSLSAWSSRFLETKKVVDEFARRPQSPLDWAERSPRLLESLSFAGSDTLSSAEFQANRRFQQALESAGSLGFDGRRIEWKDFLSVLTHTLDETLFAPESRDAPILIAGPAESAGLTADAVWFLGATEDAWPARGTTHPLLPPEVQRETQMPHATAQLDWDLAQAISARLLRSAPEVRFSFAKQVEGTERRPSRVIELLAGPPQPLPDELFSAPSPVPCTVYVEDVSQIPFPPGKIRGGARVLTFQSQCPFKAFATARLGAENWEPAQAGLTPAQRGQLLHAVLHAVWAGPPNGIRSHADLLDMPNRRSFVSGHVQQVFKTDLPANVRDRMPARYLEVEKRRLGNLVTEWLDYEEIRVPFSVVETEVGKPVTVAGLSFEVRLDRLDQLTDGSVLVIDYKSGDVSAKSWELPRPDDVQLPLYFSFALNPEQERGGLVFAKVRPGEIGFAGHVGNAQATLLQDLNGRSSLVTAPFTAEMLIGWQERIEQLARGFIAGRADVDPRDAPKTCERCGLQTICRIQEKPAAVGLEDESSDEEDGDE